MIDRTILIVTNERDITTDFIVLELQRRGLRYHRLNTENLPSYSLRFDPSMGAGSLELEFDGERLCLGEIGAGYFRRPGTPRASNDVHDPASRSYCESEWLSVAKSLYGFVGERWLNAPSAIELAENKPLQLVTANRLGFQVPSTYITNDPIRMRSFQQSYNVIGKPLKQALVGNNDETGVIFTSEIGLTTNEDDSAIRAAPVIYQHRIGKALDVRVTVVGESVFATGIHSQTDPDSALDWRRGQNAALEHSVITLPDALSAACVKLTKHFNLRFSAIDLILDEEGSWWFLEINPNGQWAWIEHRTGMPITGAIVDTLESLCAG